MEKAKNATLWIEEGYKLFAEDGLEGIQVERLARILSLNKSGFYHYFGDLEGFCSELISLHHQKVHSLIHEINKLERLDPEYLELLIRYANTVMFQVQLTRNKNSPFYEASEAVDVDINMAVKQLWADHLALDISTDLGMRYYYIVRDTFYARISFQNLNYRYLHDLVTEAKGLITKMREGVEAVSKLGR